MPVSTAFNVIYLGQMAILDPNEVSSGTLDTDAEYASGLINQTVGNLTKASAQSFSAGSYGSYGSADGSGNATQSKAYNQDNSRGNDMFDIAAFDGTVAHHIFDAIIQ